MHQRKDGRSPVAIVSLQAGIHNRILRANGKFHRSNLAGRGIDQRRTLATAYISHAHARATFGIQQIAARIDSNTNRMNCRAATASTAACDGGRRRVELSAMVIDVARNNGGSSHHRKLVVAIHDRSQLCCTTFVNHTKLIVTFVRNKDIAGLRIDHNRLRRAKRRLCRKAVIPYARLS